MKLEHPDMWLELVGATTEFGHPIAVYDDGIGPLWLLRDAQGPSRIIRAQSWESAFGIHIDESPTIDTVEVVDAYGVTVHQSGDFYRTERNDPWIVRLPDDQKVEFPDYDSALTYALEYIQHEELDLVDGYEYQDNASDTGIVHLGYYWCLDPLTPELLSDLGMTLQVEQESAYC